MEFRDFVKALVRERLMKRYKKTSDLNKIINKYKAQHSHNAKFLEKSYSGHWKAKKHLRRYHDVVTRKPWAIKAWFYIFLSKVKVNYHLLLLLDIFVKIAIKEYCEFCIIFIRKQKIRLFPNKFQLYKKKKFYFMTNNIQSKKSFVKKIRQSLKSIHLKKLRNLIPTYNINKYHNNCLDTSAWYWHFVDIIWIFVFITIYYWSLN